MSERGGSSGPDGGGSADADAGAEAGALPAQSSAIGTDLAKHPRTAGQARALVGEVIAGPELFGPGVAGATPYESDSGRWAVLGEDCVWQQQPLPEDVLATLTRYFEVPAGDGKGSVRLAATVTVHRTALDAAWEQARMLEEAVGCPEQTLRQGERLMGLGSTAAEWGEGANTYSEDSLVESGQCVSDSRGGPYPYWWRQVTLGPVVVGTSVCGGRGWDVAELQALDQQPLARMLLRVQQEIGRDAGAGSASPEPSASPSGSAPGSKEGS